MKKLMHFDKMWDNYPDDGKGGTDDEHKAGALKVKAEIGGHVDADWITDTCTVRISRAFNYSGNPIARTEGLRTVSGADGKWYAFAVREMERYLSANYGRPIIKHSAKGTLGVDPSDYQGKTGIVAFSLAGYFRAQGYHGEATGHMDLWNGSECRYENYFSNADSTSFWPVS